MHAGLSIAESGRLRCVSSIRKADLLPTVVVLQRSLPACHLLKLPDIASTFRGYSCAVAGVASVVEVHVPGGVGVRHLLVLQLARRHLPFDKGVGIDLRIARYRL